MVENFMMEVFYGKYFMIEFFTEENCLTEVFMLGALKEENCLGVCCTVHPVLRYFGLLGGNRQRGGGRLLGNFIGVTVHWNKNKFYFRFMFL